MTVKVSVYPYIHDAHFKPRFTPFRLVVVGTSQSGLGIRLCCAPYFRRAGHTAHRTSPITSTPGSGPCHWPLGQLVKPPPPVSKRVTGTQRQELGAPSKSGMRSSSSSSGHAPQQTEFKNIFLEIWHAMMQPRYGLRNTLHKIKLPTNLGWVQSPTSLQLIRMQTVSVEQPRRLARTINCLVLPQAPPCGGERGDGNGRGGKVPAFIPRLRETPREMVSKAAPGLNCAVGCTTVGRVHSCKCPD